MNKNNIERSKISNNYASSPWYILSKDLIAKDFMMRRDYIDHNLDKIKKLEAKDITLACQVSKILNIVLRVRPEYFEDILQYWNDNNKQLYSAIIYILENGNPQELSLTFHALSNNKILQEIAFGNHQHLFLKAINKILKKNIPGEISRTLHAFNNQIINKINDYNIGLLPAALYILKYSNSYIISQTLSALKRSQVLQKITTEYNDILEKAVKYVLEYGRTKDRIIILRYIISFVKHKIQLQESITKILTCGTKQEQKTLSFIMNINTQSSINHNQDMKILQNTNQSIVIEEQRKSLTTEKNLFAIETITVNTVTLKILDKYFLYNETLNNLGANTRYIYKLPITFDTAYNSLISIVKHFLNILSQMQPKPVIDLIILLNYSNSNESITILQQTLEKFKTDLTNIPHNPINISLFLGVWENTSNNANNIPYGVLRNFLDNKTKEYINNYQIKTEQLIVSYFDGDIEVTAETLKLLAETEVKAGSIGYRYHQNLINQHYSNNILAKNLLQLGDNIDRQIRLHPQLKNKVYLPEPSFYLKGKALQLILEELDQSQPYRFPCDFGSMEIHGVIRYLETQDIKPCFIGEISNLNAIPLITKIPNGENAQLSQTKNVWSQINNLIFKLHYSAAHYRNFFCEMAFRMQCDRLLNSLYCLGKYISVPNLISHQIALNMQMIWIATIINVLKDLLNNDNTPLHIPNVFNLTLCEENFISNELSWIASNFKTYTNCQAILLTCEVWALHLVEIFEKYLNSLSLDMKNQITTAIANVEPKRWITNKLLHKKPNNLNEINRFYSKREQTAIEQQSQNLQTHKKQDTQASSFASTKIITNYNQQQTNLFYSQKKSQQETIENPQNLKRKTHQVHKKHIFEIEEYERSAHQRHIFKNMKFINDNNQFQLFVCNDDGSMGDIEFEQQVLKKIQNDYTNIFLLLPKTSQLIIMYDSEFLTDKNQNIYLNAFKKKDYEFRNDNINKIIKYAYNKYQLMIMDYSFNLEEPYEAIAELLLPSDIQQSIEALKYKIPKTIQIRETTCYLNKK